MRKRNLGLVLLMATMVASNAYASRARDLVLGTGDGGLFLGNNGSSGTFYTDDAYNIFYNPAYVNDYKNWAIIEKSNASYGLEVNPTTVPTTSTSTGGTTAEGGFVSNFGNFNVGLFLNNQDSLMDTIYSTTARPAMRPIEAMIGGDMNALKWGLGATYASFTGADPNLFGGTKTNNDWTLHLGFSYMDFEPFFAYRFDGTDYSLASSPQNKMFTAGGRYHWGEWTPFAIYKSTSYNSVTNFKAFGIGLGRTMKPTEAVKLSYSIGWFRQSAGLQSTQIQSVASGTYTGVGINSGDVSIIPLNLAVEGDALSWLTLRAGLGYTIMDRVAGQSPADNTTARIGATAHAGKLDFDMAVGSGANAGANESAGQTNGQTFDLTGGVFTATSLQYHW